MSEVYFEVRVTDKGGTEIHSCGTLEEIYDIVAGAVIGSTQSRRERDDCTMLWLCVQTGRVSQRMRTVHQLEERTRSRKGVQQAICADRCNELDA